MEEYTAKTDDSSYNNGGVSLMTSKAAGYTQEFIEKLKTTDEYLAYSNDLNMIQKFPDLMEQINHYREENFDIQNKYEGEVLYDKLEELQNRYEKLLDDTRAGAFLHAEATFCRMIQDINNQILDELGFE